MPRDDLALCLEHVAADLADAYAALDRMPERPAGVRRMLDAAVAIVEAIEEQLEGVTTCS